MEIKVKFGLGDEVFVASEIRRENKVDLFRSKITEISISCDGVRYFVADMYELINECNIVSVDDVEGLGKLIDRYTKTSEGDNHEKEN